MAAAGGDTPKVLVEPPSVTKRLSENTYAKWERETDWLFFSQSNHQQRDKTGHLFTKKVAHCAWCEEFPAAGADCRDNIYLGKLRISDLPEVQRPGATIVRSVPEQLACGAPMVKFTNGRLENTKQKEIETWFDSNIKREHERNSGHKKAAILVAS